MRIKHLHALRGAAGLCLLALVFLLVPSPLNAQNSRSTMKKELSARIHYHDGEHGLRYSDRYSPLPPLTP